VAATASPAAPITVKAGVAPLRAGQGYSFLLRRLHSLSGIVPIGAFLVEHYISNAEAMKGPAAYNATVRFLNSLPFVLFLEWGLIFLPILYHGLYGVWIWYRGEGNAGDYPWLGNWMYTVQRWTGGVAFAYIIYHTWTMRFTGVHLASEPDAGFDKVYRALYGHPWVVLFYLVGVLAASWHFAYGIWLFCAKWGITTGDRARRRLGYVCLLIGLGMAGIGVYGLSGFLKYVAPAPGSTLTLMQP
jgi:succinate dehydrogenase / fumarate reductase cytochrome b subunit